MVYLVEDDIDDQEIVQAALKQHGYSGRVAVLQNGKVLMDKLLEDPSARPDVILLDLKLPIRDGFDVLAEIKWHPLFRAFRSLSSRVRKRRMMSAGAWNWVAILTFRNQIQCRNMARW